MRVGIFDPYLDTLGGGERYMLTAASCLSSDHTVDVFWDDAAILTKAQERFALHLSGVNVKANIFSPRISLLHRLLVSRHYDCIIYLSDGSLPLTLAKKLIVHFQFPVEWVKPDAFTRFKLARVSHIICNSQFTKGFIDKKFHIASTVLYPPVDVGDMKHGLEISNKKNVILTVGRFGRLSEGKNFKKQDVMIGVFKELVDKGLKDWEFIVAISFRPEDQHEVKKLEKLAKGYPISIVKNRTSKDLALLYEKASIYWHAAGFGEDLTKHPERAEHFGIATVEAMTAGAVPVVFNGGGQREIVEEGKTGFLWDTRDELQEKTLALIEKQVLWDELSQNAVKKSSEFSKGRFCREIHDLLQ